MISALSSGPPADSWVYRSSTSAGRPHLTEPSSSKYAGQSRNVIWPSNPVAAHPRRREAAPSAPASPPGPAERIAASRDPDDAVGRVRTLALATMTTARGREILSGNHQHRQGPRQPPWHVLLLHTRPGSPRSSDRRRPTERNYHEPPPRPEYQAQRVEELVSRQKQQRNGQWR